MKQSLLIDGRFNMTMLPKGMIYWDDFSNMPLITLPTDSNTLCSV